MVDGDANWLNFQRRYSVENFYREILSRNPNMVQYAIEVFATDVSDYQSRNSSSLSQEQNNWINNLSARIFEIVLFSSVGDFDGLYRAVRVRYNGLLI